MFYCTENSELELVGCCSGVSFLWDGLLTAPQSPTVFWRQFMPISGRSSLGDGFLALPQSPVDIVGMVVDPTPRIRAPAPSPPPSVLAATDYPRNGTETRLETELTDLSIDVRLLQSHVRERDARDPLPGLDRRLRELRQRHGALSHGVGQLTAGRRLRFEELVRPLSAELDELHRLLAERRAQPAAAVSAAWQQRDAGGPIRTRRSIYVDNSSPAGGAGQLPDSPPRPAPAPADSSPASPGGGEDYNEYLMFYIWYLEQ